MAASTIGAADVISILFESHLFLFRRSLVVFVVGWMTSMSRRCSLPEQRHLVVGFPKWHDVCLRTDPSQSRLVSLCQMTQYMVGHKCKVLFLQPAIHRRLGP